jgi:hypothetical protein
MYKPGREIEVRTPIAKGRMAELVVLRSLL